MSRITLPRGQSLRQSGLSRRNTQVAVIQILDNREYMQSGKGTTPAIRGLVPAICSSCRSENGGC
jgi:hypothetical protein